jgi:hypothetical protein
MNYCSRQIIGFLCFHEQFTFILIARYVSGLLRYIVRTYVGLIVFLQVIGIITLALVVQYGLQVVQYQDLLTGSAFLLAVVTFGLLVSFIELVTFFYDDDTLYGVRKSLFVCHYLIRNYF